MLGGHVGRWTFDEQSGRELAAHADAMVAGHRWLAADLDQRPHAGRCRRCLRQNAAARRIGSTVGGRDDPDNPYLGFLALAERIIVTSDSMSMLVEAIATGKPVFVFDLGDPRRRWLRLSTEVAGR